jgi:spore germination cell wall hydrolase CwlJ-like protein
MAVAVLGGFGLISQTASSVPILPREAEPAAVATMARQAQTFTPFQVRDIAPDKAVALNAAVPIVDGPNPPARPFQAAAANSTAFARSLECLTEAIYYEAAREPEQGQRAVAQVILNRVRHAAFPNTVCGVVYQGSERPTGCQFSFTCDGSLAHSREAGAWDRARKIAEDALSGYVYAPVGLATHYHTTAIRPWWAASLARAVTIGSHIFYRWHGEWGDPRSYRRPYVGAEGYAGRSAPQSGGEQPDQGRVEIASGVSVHRGARPIEIASADDGSRVRIHRTVQQADEPSAIRVHRGASAEEQPASLEVPAAAGEPAVVAVR